MAMAKKARVNGANKSQAIRDALSENPRAGSKEIVARLAEKGISVSGTLVYYIKSKIRKAKRQQKRLAAASVTGNGSAVDVVLRVKALAHEVGGLKQLKQLVDVLAE
jgi:hypothetical protein